MMQRRSFVELAALTVTAGRALAQSPAIERKRRVGLLTGGSQAGASACVAAFKQGMADLGQHEGRNIDCRCVFANGLVEPQAAT